MQLLQHIGILSRSSPRHKLLDPYLNAMSARPSGQHQWLINRLLVELQDGGYPMTGFLALLNAETEQASLINALNPAQAFGKVGSPVFTPNVGWYSLVASNTRLETSFGFSSIAGWSNTNNHVGCWCVDDNGRDTYDIGGYNSVNYGLLTRSTANNFAGRAMNASLMTASPTVPTAIGMSVMSRTASNAATLIKNGVQAASSATAQAGDYSATTFAALAIYSTYSGRTLSVATCGRGLTTPEALVQYTALNRFLSAW